MSRILYFVILFIFSLQSCLTQDTISAKAQFKSDTTSIGPFVRYNDPQAIKVNTGFWYSIDTLANGVYPALTDSVTVSYTARLIPLSNPQTPASSLPVVDDTTTTVLLSSSISGFQQGLIFFPAGSVGQLYISSGLAFGVSPHKNGKIPPNANLLYEIKLIGVKGTRLASDIATIDSYLSSISILPQNDVGSGIRYTVDQGGNVKIRPHADDSLLVTYTERILMSDTLITSVDTEKVALRDQVTCWRIMIPEYFTEGSTITIYSPSGYAYGSSASTSIPANSNMEYKVTLIKVFPH